MGTKTISIHADEFEYTKTGLKQRKHFKLEPGNHYKIVVTRPDRIKAISTGLAGFGPNSSFPTPASLALLLAPKFANLRATTFKPGNTLQLFGHAQLEHNDARNKPLSERRAKVIAAILTADVAGVQTIADEEKWGLREQQVMLRVVGCDPGPIDGKEGVLTEAAVRKFQSQYSEGLFHKDAGQDPIDPALKLDGDMGPLTGAALVDAFTIRCTPNLKPDQLHPSHPTTGCSEYNQTPDRGARAAASRRVSIVVHPRLPPFHENAPCLDGDISVCPANDERPARCMWYRAHIDDPAFTDVKHTHYLASWLELPNGKFLLSTLTTVPDEEEVEFQVMTSVHRFDGENLPEGFLQQLLGNTIKTNPVAGVAQAVWDAPPNFAPGPNGRIRGSSGQEVVPIFKVSHQGTGAVLHDSYPTNEIVVLFQRSLDAEDYIADAHTSLELRSAQGSENRKVVADVVPHDERHHALRFEGVQPDDRYTLVLSRGNSHEHTLFADVAFSTLESLGDIEQTAPLVEPPPEEEETEDFSEVALLDDESFSLSGVL